MEDRTMMLEKRRLTFDEINAQSAHLLPARQLLTLIVIQNIANGLRVNVTVSNNTVALQVCAAVNAINALFAAQCARLTCKILQ
jgi:hypothetical protein